jgi:lipoprotein-anchoring transpeptidase ErfK/SrfK
MYPDGDRQTAEVISRLLQGLQKILVCLVLIGVPSALWAITDDTLPTVMIPDVLVYSESDAEDADIGSVLVVDKRRQVIIRYRFDSEWRETQRWDCSTGKAAGFKEAEGDQKTPEGLYFITRHVEQRHLSETYGSRALTLDYPNWYDRQLGRTGSNIWLHGTNKILRERDSNGCVVLENSAIDDLARQIRIRRTPVIIVDHLKWWPRSEAAQMAAILLDITRRWQNALLGGSYAQFRQLYRPDAAPSRQWWQAWCRLRQSTGEGNAMIRSEMDNVEIYRSAGVLLLLFDHYLSTAQQRVPAGRRMLIIRSVNEQVALVGDIYQDSPADVDALGGEKPLFAAWRRLWQNLDDNQFTAREGRPG